MRNIFMSVLLLLLAGLEAYGFHSANIYWHESNVPYYRLYEQKTDI